MNIIEIIERKRDGFALSEHEIHYFIEEYMNENIMDYQASALLMAIYLKGMNEDELFYLTDAMIQSGSVLDLSSLDGISADKHSTGGVGDKTTLVLGPMLAACGIEFAKMSGRGLSFTGGTLDKLEAISKMNVNLSIPAFLKQVKQIHIAIMGQSESMVLADKKLYALRDVTGTVSSIPLIAASIISKKIAAGADIILLDVKYGDGAFMQTKEEAEQLALVMIDLAARFNKKVSAEITCMDQPLGYAIGNALEVKEAIAALKGQGPSDLTDLCIESAAHILRQASLCESMEEARIKAEKTLYDQSAFHKFMQMVEFQGGDVNEILHPDMLIKNVKKYPVYVPKDGYIKSIACQKLGMIAAKLGAGRMKMNDTIDHSAGILLNHKCGEYVKTNDVLCFVYTNQTNHLDILDDIVQCFKIEQQHFPLEPLIYRVIKK